MLERNTPETEEINLQSKQKVHKTFLVIIKFVERK